MPDKETVIKFTLLSLTAKMPNRATPYCAGWDLYSDEDAVVLNKGGFATIGTGVIVDFPSSFYALVYPRSGISRLFPNYLSNNVGLIDSDYRGEIRVPLINWTDDRHMDIHKGDRIAQMVFMESPDTSIRLEWVPADKISTTLRGQGGFGSTGGFR